MKNAIEYGYDGINIGSKDGRLDRIFRFLNTLIKRDLDIILSIFFLALASPVMVLLAMFVAMDGGPILFAHRRVGRKGMSFRCWKFRTMIVGAEDCLSDYLRYHPEAAREWALAQKLLMDPRVTGIGAFLRKANLDEIPQMWNVLIGQMSLVGPRPVTEAEMIERYGHHGSVVTSVKPGVTGPWQIMPSRNDVDYNRRVQIEAQYVASWNLITDLSILLRTVPVVLQREAAR